MARRKQPTTQSGYDQNPSLTKPRKEVAEELQCRIEIGKKLQLSQIHSERDLDDFKRQNTKWYDYNKEYLRRCFDLQSSSNRLSDITCCVPWYFPDTLDEVVQIYRKGIGEQITELESILDELELIPETTPSKSPQPTSIVANSNSVFIVHGHDEALKSQVARFIEKFKLEVIILHEQPNKGQTIIEKFEVNAARACFAVVLLTPDDVVVSKNSTDKQEYRARQNVILELGYFCGKLGRNRVCALYSDGVELPSDYIGVVYTPLNNGDDWKLKLAREMKAAELDIDLNLAM